MDANVDVMITVDLDSRPRVESQPHMEQLVPIQAETCSSAHGILEQLRPIFLSSTDALRALKETLWMRVDFGHVIIHRRKKIQGNKMSYTDFAEMASQYGTRGGAELDVKLEDDGLASSTIRHLLDPTTEFGGGLQELRYQENISVKIQERNLMADFKSHPNRPATLANVRLVEPNRWPPLRWAIIAPDRKYDWAIRVDCGRIVQPIPTEMLSLIASITIKSEAHGGLPEDFLRKTPTVHLGSGTTWIDKIESIQVKASVSIPFRDTPYVIEISTHREWQGASTRGEPQSWLSLGVYGVHWDAELNSTKANDTKKDWGYEQSDIWRGSADTATGQFEEFVCYVLEVLSALEDVKVRC
ncbi:hypothetical protein QQS21_002381 [Conoideocrella luteorostrata]|uniref:DUF7905 domain-containing protein n=1 Tax=Conoideocrella luteorostrata TaxID=1105319 RepID=A0AAJ0CV49_9HYPO|nr:hypothetical protein QQS21_002381 [Conoideocrella luteorostrata]